MRTNNIISTEQFRIGKTNNDMAALLKCSRPTYERKKKTGKFYASEITMLCKLFNCSFEYLFSTTDTPTKSA